MDFGFKPALHWFMESSLILLLLQPCERTVSSAKRCASASLIINMTAIYLWVNTRVFQRLYSKLSVHTAKVPALQRKAKISVAIGSCAWNGLANSISCKWIDILRQWNYSHVARRNKMNCFNPITARQHIHSIMDIRALYRLYTHGKGHNRTFVWIYRQYRSSPHNRNVIRK